MFGWCKASGAFLIWETWGEVSDGWFTLLCIGRDEFLFCIFIACAHTHTFTRNNISDYMTFEIHILKFHFNFQFAISRQTFWCCYVIAFFKFYFFKFDFSEARVEDKIAHLPVKSFTKIQFCSRELFWKRTFKIRCVLKSTWFVKNSQSYFLNLQFRIFNFSKIIPDYCFRRLGWLETRHSGLFL